MSIPIAAITDEFSFDLDTALDAMAQVGMTGAELRLIGDRNIIDFSDDEVARVRERVEQHGMTVVSIASPVLKYVLPDAPSIDARFQQDVFGAPYTIADHPRLSKRAFEIAEQTGAKIVRVFSYWRTTAPEQCFDRIVASLRELADRGGRSRPHHRPRKRARVQCGDRRGSWPRVRCAGPSGAEKHLGSGERLDSR
jgi:sugar phosphate isomerase/epimerase